MYLPAIAVLVPIPDSFVFLMPCLPEVLIDQELVFFALALLLLPLSPLDSVLLHQLQLVDVLSLLTPMHVVSYLRIEALG